MKCETCANARCCPPKEKEAMEALNKLFKGEGKCSGYKPKSKEKLEKRCPFCGAVMRKG